MPCGLLPEFLRWNRYESYFANTTFDYNRIRLTRHLQHWVHASFQKENRIEWMTNAIDACLSFAFLRCFFFTLCILLSLNSVFRSNAICSCHKTDLIWLNMSGCQCHSHISSACCATKIVWFHLRFYIKSGKIVLKKGKKERRYVKDDYNIRGKSHHWEQKEIYLILCQTNGNNNRRQWNVNGDTIWNVQSIPEHTHIFTYIHKTHLK